MTPATLTLIRKAEKGKAMTVDLMKPNPEFPNVTIPLVEIEYSIEWMRNYPQLAGESIKNFLNQTATAKEIKFKTYPCEGFLTISAYNEA